MARAVDIIPTRVWFAALSIVLLQVFAAAAQVATGEITGHIVSARDTEPLAQVEVTLVGMPFTTVTKADGTFHLAGLPPGEYVVQTTAVGYQPIRQPLTIAAGDVRQIDIALTPTTITLSDSAEVHADPFEASQSGEAAFTLQGDERKNLASVLADDPLRAVQSAPGVTAQDDFSSEFSVRGAPFRRVGLYLDGILLHSPFHTTDGQPDNGSLSIFSGDMTDAMTMYEGAWPVRYADRTAGILAVDTRAGTREEPRFQVGIGMTNASVSGEGPIGSSKRGAWLVAVRRSYLQYILNRIDFGDQPPVAFAFTDAQARVDYDLSTRNSLSLNVLDGASDVDRTRFRAELGPNTVMTSGFHSTLVNLAERFVSPKLLLTSRVAWSREDGHVANRDQLALSRGSYDQMTLRADATVPWSDRHRAEFGGEAHHVQQDELTTEVVHAPAVVTLPDAFDTAEYIVGAYLQESFSAGRTHLSGGGRLDRNSSLASTVGALHASASRPVASKTTLQLDWGRYAQFPGLDQIASVFAAHPLLPERATQYEAAVEQRLDDRTRLRVEVSDREDRDLLARPALEPRRSGALIIDANPRASLLNSQHGYARGALVVLQRRSANGFTGWLSYAYGRTRIVDDVLRLAFPSDYDQRHTVTAYVSRRLRPTINLSGRVSYGSGMPIPGFYARDSSGYDLTSDRNGLRVPAYQRVDVRVGKELVRHTFHATLFAEVINATNHVNRDFDTPGPYDRATGKTTPNFYQMFPVLPSIGLVLNFGTPHLRTP